MAGTGGGGAMTWNVSFESNVDPNKDVLFSQSVCDRLRGYET